MAFPQKWLTEPVEVPLSGDDITPQIQQFASALRKLALEGTITPNLAQWLYDYEQRYTPIDKRIMEKQPDAAPAQKPLPEGIAAGVAEVLKEMAAGLKELNAGIKNMGAAFNDGLKNMDLSYANAADKLNEGIEKITAGYSQLTDDHRSFLGLLFPHTSAMYQTANESMVAFRRGLVAEANAAKTVSASEAGGLDAEAGRAVMGLLTKAAEKKFLGDEEPKKTPEAKEEAKKEEPKK